MKGLFVNSTFRRTVVGAATVACVASAVSACGFGGSDDTVTAANTITFLAPVYRDGADGTKSQWDAIIADFQKMHPAIKVNLQMESWNGIKDVVRTRLQSQRTTPDILNLDAYAGFARDGMLYEAKDVLSDNVMKDFQPTFASNASIDGRQYGMPLFASTRTLFYNKDLFARVGLNTPPKTWTELLTDAKKVNALGDGISGYGMPLGGEEAQAETSVWTFGAGGQWSAGSAITIDTPSNLDGVTQMQKVIDAKVTEANAGATDRKDMINGFVQGKIGMIEGLPPVIEAIAKKNPGLKYATAPTPTKTGSPVTLGVADHLMAFVKDGTRHDAIKTFLDYFYSPTVYAKFVKTEGFIPVTAGAVEALKDDPVTRAFGPTLPSARFYPSNNPKWAAAQAALQQNIGTIAQGASASEVLKKIQQAADDGK